MPRRKQINKLRYQNMQLGKEKKKANTQKINCERTTTDININTPAEGSFTHLTHSTCRFLYSHGHTIHN